MISNLGLLFLVAGSLCTFFAIFIFIKDNIIKSSIVYKNFFLFYKISFFLILSSFVFLVINIVYLRTLISVYENSILLNLCFIKFQALGEITKEVYYYGY